MKLATIALSLTLAACHVSHEGNTRARPELQDHLDHAAPNPTSAVSHPAGNAAESDVESDGQVNLDSEAFVDMAEPSRQSKTPSPTSKNWERAVVFPLARNRTSCEARRWGSFVRVGCSGTFSSLVEQLAGNPVGLKFATVRKENPFSETQYVVFPLHPGDRRVIQLGELSGGWRQEWSVSAPALISASWLEGESNPQVVVD